MSTASTYVPCFDEIVKHPDDSVTAFSHFPPSETVLRELVDELFAKNWSARALKAPFSKFVSFKRPRFAFPTAT
jgi:hypothetical protein